MTTTTKMTTTATGTVQPANGTELQQAPRGPDLLRTMVELARMAPRDDAAVERRLLDTLAAYPALADKSVYRMKFKDKRAASGFTTISGLSIRAAETIAAEMGYVWTEGAIAEETADYIDVLGTAFDAQRANLQRKPFRVSRLEKDARGQTVVLNDRRMLMGIQAGLSKAVRNAILAIVPVRLRTTYETRCRELIAGGDLAELAPADKVTACLTDFAAHFQVSPERLVAYVGRPMLHWVRADLADLRSLFNAIEDGETTIADALPAADSHAQPAKPEQELPQGRVVENAPGPASPAAIPEEPAQTAPAPTPATMMHSDGTFDEEAATVKAIAAIEATTSKAELDKATRDTALVATLAKLSKPKRARVLGAIGTQRGKLSA